jgi:hypothetical protein
MNKRRRKKAVKKLDEVVTAGEQHRKHKGPRLTLKEVRALEALARSRGKK